MRIKGYFQPSNYFCIMLVLFIISCNQGVDSDKIGPTLEYNKSGQSTVFIDFESLTPYNPFRITQEDIQLPDFTIVSYVNASCPSCIADIDNWKEFYNDNWKDVNLNLRLIFYSHDNFEYLKFLCESRRIKGFPFQFYLDEDNDFRTKYPIFMNLNVENTVLLNKMNKVLSTGNPFHSRDKKREYINLIRE